MCCIEPGAKALAKNDAAASEDDIKIDGEGSIKSFRQYAEMLSQPQKPKPTHF